MIKIDLPKNVKFIIDTLESAGYEAYAVGGCVRDSILGRTPNDWDITTSAKPLETKALFKKTFDTGIKHGTISVLLGKEIYEVTTYRIDGEYEDDYEEGEYADEEYAEEEAEEAEEAEEEPEEDEEPDTLSEEEEEEPLFG